MKSFLQGKKTLEVAGLRPPGSGAPAPTGASLASTRPPAGAGKPHAHAPGAAGGTPTVEVVKEGDKVVRLVITCTCGERVEVECLYPAGR